MQVLRNMVIAQGMLLTILGVLLGTGGALWLTRVLASFPFAVKALALVRRRSGSGLGTCKPRYSGMSEKRTSERIAVG